MFLKDAFHRENIEFGITKSFDLLKAKYGFEQIKSTESHDCRENMYGLRLKKNDLQIHPFIAMFEYQIFFTQTINGKDLEIRWRGLWGKFMQGKNVPQSDKIKRKSYWDNEIPAIIDYSKPVTKNEMENMLEKQFEFIDRNFKGILENGDISFLLSAKK